MEFRADRRGQAVMVGAILLLAIFVLALALVQTQIVPDENRQVEFEHNQQVQGEIQDVRNAILRAGSVGTAQPQSVQLGTRYPQRTLTINPPPAGGTLRAESFGNDAIAIDNAVAVGDAETRDYWDGSERTFPTGQLWYTPGYNEYGNAPTTVYESSVVYNDFADENVRVPLTGQRLIDGRTLSIVALDGSFAENDIERMSVDPRAVSVATRTVTVTGDDDENVTIAVRTELNETDWEELLAPEFERNGGHVVGNESGVSVQGTGDDRELVVQLDGERRYNLRMGLVSVDGPADHLAEETYITDVSGDGQTVNEGGTSARVVAEVRDQFNNPVGGVEVEVRDDGPEVGSIEPVENTTDSEGRVKFDYQPPAAIDESQTATFDLEFDNGTERRVSYAIDVRAEPDDEFETREYFAGWDIDEILDRNENVTHSDGELTIELVDGAADPDIEMVAYAEDDRGDPIEDVGFQFTTTDSGVAEFADQPDPTDADGSADEMMTVNEGEARVFASAPADGDRLDIEILRDPTDVVLEADIGEAHGPNNSNVTFELSNEGNTPVTLDAFRLDSATGQATNLANGDDPELSIDGSAVANRPGLGNEYTIDATRYDFGGPNTDQDQYVLADGESATVELAEFRGDGQPQGDPIDMQGETIEMTWVDDDDEEYSVTIEISNGD